ncbi:hypothetical protein PV327_011158 [Microctonus hyperodae]|uniref:Mutator-like transposase domain-containing protein n=1 Tax=Microctonus hyperodae TaxID=165561 RepID=A0AA39FLA0_MICHY|nr:hypothetical protein PV327_011158 [Microctonus hyperodae]
MGWSTRAAGRQYDSKNGFGAIIGQLTGMEPHVAKKLVVDSDILKAENIEVGVLVGDDDSSTIATCRAAANHPIIKQSDVNHTSGGGDSLGLVNAIRSIPYHAFDNHSKCGAWYGYIADKENYVHKVIPGGFEDPILFKELKKIFDKLASNAQKFSNGASSNANESLNAMMASKASKSRCYSRTASADYRFACAIGQKNIGEGYTQEISGKKNLSPSKLLQQHISVKQKLLLKRRELIKTHAYKKRRMQLKKFRTILRRQKENQEGVIYQSNCALLTEPAIPEKETCENDADSEEDTEFTYGFIDTLKIIRKVTGKKTKGSCTISGLADSLDIPKAEAHNVINDCAILHKILLNLKISSSVLINSATPFLEQSKSWELAVTTKNNIYSLLPLKSVSLSTRQKLARAGITMSILNSKYDPLDDKSLKIFLFEKIKTKELESLQKTTIKKIVKSFKENLL